MYMKQISVCAQNMTDSNEPSPKEGRRKRGQLRGRKIGLPNKGCRSKLETGKSRVSWKDPDLLCVGSCWWLPCVVPTVAA